MQSFETAAGTLTRRVQIQQAITAVDDFGQPITEWTTVFSTWAAIDYVRGSQTYVPEGFSSQVTHVITIRARSGVTLKPGMRIVYGAHTFVLQVPDDVEMRGVTIRLYALDLTPTT